ncbi:HAD family hydrolase [Enemella sp. A6]|uniref:HAD family hydrolase n=1 Tax=Enemella sp. A6 TaxID=3440152 RepID=UPI003EB959CC
MTWQPRLLALDIDGTVIDHDGTMPDEIRAAVQRALTAGTRVVLATGRAWHSTRPVFDRLGLPPGMAVASNGAVIVDYPPVEYLREVTFDPGDVIERVARIAPRTAIAAEVVGVGYRVSQPFPDGELDGEIHLVDLDDLAAEPVTRVILRDSSVSHDDFTAMAHRLGLEGVSYSIGYSSWLDIAPQGINKAAALAGVCAELGIDAADVLALGDGHNDIEMLGWAGRGVALGDAPAEVCAVADAITGRFIDGGTAAELNRWFPAN